MLPLGRKEDKDDRRFAYRSPLQDVPSGSY